MSESFILESQIRLPYRYAVGKWYGAFLLGLTMALLAWRTALGGLNAWNTQAGSMMLGFPEWIVYCGIVPALALTAVIGLVQALRGFGDGVRE